MKNKRREEEFDEEELEYESDVDLDWVLAGLIIVLGFGFFTF